MQMKPLCCLCFIFICSQIVSRANFLSFALTLVKVTSERASDTFFCKSISSFSLSLSLMSQSTIFFANEPSFLLFSSFPMSVLSCSCFRARFEGGDAAAKFLKPVNFLASDIQHLKARHVLFLKAGKKYIF